MVCLLLLVGEISYQLVLDFIDDDLSYFFLHAASFHSKKTKTAQDKRILGSWVACNLSKAGRPATLLPHLVMGVPFRCCDE